MAGLKADHRRSIVVPQASLKFGAVPLEAITTCHHPMLSLNVTGDANKCCKVVISFIGWTEFN